MMFKKGTFGCFGGCHDNNVHDLQLYTTVDQGGTELSLVPTIPCRLAHLTHVGRDRIVIAFCSIMRLE